MSDAYRCHFDDAGQCSQCGRWRHEACVDDDAAAARAYDEAMAAARRRFRIECDADGQPFTWSGPATNEAHAFRQAAEQIADEFPMVHAARVRLIACIEVQA